MGCFISATPSSLSPPPLSFAPSRTWSCELWSLIVNIGLSWAGKLVIHLICLCVCPCSHTHYLYACTLYFILYVLFPECLCWWYGSHRWGTHWLDTWFQMHFGTDSLHRYRVELRVAAASLVPFLLGDSANPWPLCLPESEHRLSPRAPLRKINKV